jgi:hypothetical protein
VAPRAPGAGRHDAGPETRTHDERLHSAPVYRFTRTSVKFRMELAVDVKPSTDLR